MTRDENKTRETLAHRLYEKWREAGLRPTVGVYDDMMALAKYTGPEPLPWHHLAPQEQHAWLAVADEAARTRAKAAAT